MNSSWSLFIIAVTFSVVTGANEGGAIIAMGLQEPALRPIGAVLALTAGVMIAPVVLGTAVAQTLAQRLVGAGTPDSRTAFGVGLCAALVVVWVLSVMRLPTSLSLALIGGVTGAGIGFGLPVSWSGVSEILLFGVVAPLAGAVTGAAIACLLRWFWRGRRLPAVMRWATLAGYLGQVVAYGANGGQKLVAVFAVCGTAGTLSLHTGIATTILIGGCFAAGTVMSLRRLAGLGRDLMAVRPVHHLSAEIASCVAVLTSMAAGMPVSMNQVIASAFVGAGASEGRRRIRWKAVTRLATAWLFTLPASVGVALGVAASARGIR